MPEAVIGRERELEGIAAFLSDVLRGPTALFLAGEPGIGKTTLWQAGVERAAASAFLVLSARPAEPEAALAFSALTDLVEPVVDEALTTLPAPQRRALAAALSEFLPGLQERLLRTFPEHGERVTSPIGAAMIVQLGGALAEPGCRRDGLLQPRRGPHSPRRCWLAPESDDAAEHVKGVRSA